MLTFIPTQLLTSTASQPAFAEVRLEPGPPTSKGRSGSTIRGSVESQTSPEHVNSALPSSRDPPSQTSAKVHSIPIHPPH